SRYSAVEVGVRRGHGLGHVEQSVARGSLQAMDAKRRGIPLALSPALRRIVLEWAWLGRCVAGLAPGPRHHLDVGGNLPLVVHDFFGFDLAVAVAVENREE